MLCQGPADPRGARRVTFPSPRIRFPLIALDGNRGKDVAHFAQPRGNVLVNEARVRVDEKSQVGELARPRA